MMKYDMLTHNTVVTWHPELITASVDDEVIVMGLIRGHYVGLDDIGSVLWRLLEQPQTVGQLCDHLGQRYRGEAEVIMADVLGFLEEMRGLDLITADTGAPAR